MIEEKSAYDAEEMNILKETLVRREREKHFLEKEVERYWQMVFEEGQVDSSEDQVLKRASESITEKPTLELGHSSPDYAIPSTEIKDYNLNCGKELPMPDLDEDSESLKQVEMHLHPSIDYSHFLTSSDKFSREFQDREVLSVDEKPSSQGKELQKLEVYQQCSLSPSPEGLSFRKSTSPQYKQELNLAASTSLCEGLASKTSGIGNENRNPIPYNNDKRDKQGNDQDNSSKDPRSTVLNTEPSVLDVHVIDDKSDEMNAEKSDRDMPTMTGLNTQRKIQIVSSDTASVFLTTGCPRGRSSPSDMRRNSMSPIDYERYKIDNEVEHLRERLRIVQEGKEKLNFSVGHRERERIQLQLLEDIASQLQEIRQLTEPGKAES